MPSNAARDIIHNLFQHGLPIVDFRARVAVEQCRHSSGVTQHPIFSTLAGTQQSSLVNGMLVPLRTSGRKRRYSAGGWLGGDASSRSLDSLIGPESYL